MKQSLGEWRVLGFDGRENIESHMRSPLPAAVREELLLRPEITSPLSVDLGIWPTRFQYHPRILNLKGSNGQKLIDVDEDCGGGLWLNLHGMKSRLAESFEDATLIAVELFIPQHAGVDEFVGLIDHEPTPMTLPTEAQFLGLDVADSGMVSGLSNCGYSRAEREQLRPEWQSKINDFGLLQAEQDALIFRELTDTRVPEHAPFWVYKIHRLAEC
jgi:hypothetical protein